MLMKTWLQEIAKIAAIWPLFEMQDMWPHDRE